MILGIVILGTSVLSTLNGYSFRKTFSFCLNSKTRFVATNKRSRWEVLHVRDCAGVLSTDWHGHLGTSPYQSTKVERNRSSRSWDLEPSPCTDSNWPLHATVSAVPHQRIKFERDRSSHSRDRETTLACTCACATSPLSYPEMSWMRYTYHVILLFGPEDYAFNMRQS